MNVERVRHRASDRTGHLASEQYRFGLEGCWVVWDDHPRPSWHPAKWIERDARYLADELESRGGTDVGITRGDLDDGISVTRGTLVGLYRELAQLREVDAAAQAVVRDYRTHLAAGGDPARLDAFTGHSLTALARMIGAKS